MKRSVLLPVIVLFAAGYAVPVLAQETLPEVTVVATNYKYLKSVGGKEVSQPVQLLQRTAAEYDVKKSDYYEDDYDSYFVSFVLPEGQILAAYDKNGKLLRTAEKYGNVKLPAAVSSAVAKKYPDWRVSKDVYMVTYYDDKGTDKKYKLLLENGNKRMKVKVNEAGEFF
ncbi:nicotinate-nucleotide adenylyltransferase [Niastella koreensis]|uniref:Nicotinic acid mononucleotide adenyltransferase n=2 Tax=Niastella koreensis TaxID=354356 RepID=G8TBV6_NIAKG|nr:nicotinic acid mononucleotide adenylyltransferase [Niastella koreensis]AEV98238.1 nicotinic acid mononucleotide adenyltransferase [Niastella koreensis GR20-10]OQP53306.1 nicotinate-nucleotide adenylyltransferase [Niastella koreensis]